MEKKPKVNKVVSNAKRQTEFNSYEYSWDNLSELQKQNINAGLDDIKNGRVMSSDEFWRQLKSECPV